MTVNVVVKPKAKADIESAVAHYTEIGHRLGDRFLHAVETTLEQIGTSPLHCAIVYKEVRQLRLRGFPYVVSYVFDGQTVSVIAVLYGARDAKHWKSR
ncbi:MAG: type II toxin-antitoxin system RelE/ParE family toxin [Pirellulaceae bacterium]|nr:type II toxin-antitoxin system RelE/ParE family toxin [Pirellulaceae bacterium]